MPYSISWPDNTFLAQFSGRITAKEVDEVNHAFSGDMRMEVVRFSMWDFSGATSVDMPLDDIEDAAAFDKGVTYTRSSLRGALIVANDQVRDAVEKYLAVADDLQVNWDTRVFDNIETARIWLDGCS